MFDNWTTPPPCRRLAPRTAPTQLAGRRSRRIRGVKRLGHGFERFDMPRAQGRPTTGPPRDRTCAPVPIYLLVWPPAGAIDQPLGALHPLWPICPLWGLAVDRLGGLGERFALVKLTFDTRAELLDGDTHELLLPVDTRVHAGPGDGVHHPVLQILRQAE